MDELFSSPDDGPYWQEIRDLMAELQERVDDDDTPMLYLLANIQLDVAHLKKRIEDLTELVRSLVEARRKVQK